MRRPALSVLSPVLLVLLLLAMPFAGSFAKPQSRPGLREAEKRMNIPLDPPAFAPGRSAPDPAQLEDEAAELARLSADIPAQIQKVNHKLLPKDLNDQLKRIEKLAKHLRSEVRP